MPAGARPLVSVVSPLCNEEGCVAELVARLGNVLRGLECDYEDDLARFVSWDQIDNSSLPKE